MLSSTEVKDYASPKVDVIKLDLVDQLLSVSNLSPNFDDVDSYIDVEF